MSAHSQGQYQDFIAVIFFPPLQWSHGLRLFSCIKEDFSLIEEEVGGGEDRESTPNLGACENLL